MNVETEVKIRLSSQKLDEVRRRLDDLGSQLVSPRRREVNLLFDYGDGRLQKAGRALRLRTYGSQALLTFKGKRQDDPLFKKRPEIQTRVEDSEATRKILRALGMSVCFRYDKFREIRKWVVSGHSVEVCIDETAVGNFVEIEGDPDAIQAAAKLFGWRREDFIRTSYVELYAERGKSRPG